ncbi:MAG: hypothetical protein J6Q38_02280 [Clostridia bacterium]|nr:hypothetical protein [Clostridia bacterium]
MNNNAVISAPLEELLASLDARAYITIFTKSEDGKEALLRSNYVYKLLSDDEFLGNYSNFRVIGLTIILKHISILIKEA